MPERHQSSVICIKPIGGLCNRLRAIDSAIAVAKENHSSVHVIWPMNDLLNCRFEDLFELPASIDKIGQPNTSGWLNKAIEKFYRTKIGGVFQDLYLRYIVRSFDVVLTYDRMEGYKNCDYQGCDFAAMTANKRAYITTFHAFYDAARPFADFVPVRQLQNIIDDYTKGFENVIGVHIRRTDNRQSLAASPTTEFVELMQTEVRQDSNVRFFVATDSPSEEEYLNQTFPGRIITYPKKSLARHDPEAIKDAVIDLYCLSKCRKLIGSYYSSFTDTAHQINGIEYTIVNDRS
ncbi:hypothetical protein [Chamaesiphon polymorphus]|nr:hypothetical protein [Chamaesiphon polymorphus]